MSESTPGVAVLGASGYIGQQFARLLARHPWFGLPVLIASDRSAGRRLEDVWALADDVPKELAGARIRTATPAGLARDGVRIAFGALPSGTAGPFETACVRRRISVFTNSSDHRMDDAVPLLVPEVNGNHLPAAPKGGRGRIAPILVTNPNCTTTGLVVALAPVLGLLEPRAVHVATYQALSGAGLPGVPSLSITGNVLPHIPGEEEKVAREAAKILGRPGRDRVRPLGIPFVANCARVPVPDGHLEAVTVEATARPTLRSLRNAWRAFDPLARLSLPTAPHPPIVVRSEPDRPQPSRDLWAGSPARARGMAVVVGRVRWEPPYLRFYLLSHNAVRGGAGGSVLNAEYARMHGYLPAFGGAGEP